MLAFSIPPCFSKPRQHRECCAAGSERVASLNNEKQGTQQPLWMEQQFAGEAAVGQKTSPFQTLRGRASTRLDVIGIGRRSED